jgi:hypothetical protein
VQATLLLVVSILTAPAGWACSPAFNPIRVGSSFTAQVSGYDGLVKGLLLNLTDSQGRKRSATTDAHGIAHFQFVAAGTHYLRADHDNGYGVVVDVKGSGPANVVIPLEWPSVDPIHVRSISGTMGAPDAVPGQLEQRVLSLELLAGVSGRILATIDTAAKSRAFDFGKLAPGLYFINVLGDIGGLISIAVDPGAPERASKLDLNLIWTSCGLMYMDQSRCPQPELHLKSLQGRAKGSIFGGHGWAEIVLLDATQAQVAHVRTDHDGNFSFSGLPVGTFELRIEGDMTPVHTPIHIEPAAEASSLEVRAGYLTSCSEVRVK